MFYLSRKKIWVNDYIYWFYLIHWGIVQWRLVKLAPIHYFSCQFRLDRKVMNNSVCALFSVCTTLHNAIVGPRTKWFCRRNLHSLTIHSCTYRYTERMPLMVFNWFNGLDSGLTHSRKQTATWTNEGLIHWCIIGPQRVHEGRLIYLANSAFPRNISILYFYIYLPGCGTKRDIRKIKTSVTLITSAFESQHYMLEYKLFKMVSVGWGIVLTYTHHNIYIDTSIYFAKWSSGHLSNTTLLEVKFLVFIMFHVHQMLIACK